MKLDKKYKVAGLLEEKRDELAETTRKHVKTDCTKLTVHLMEHSSTCVGAAWKLLVSLLCLMTIINRLSKKLVLLRK